MPSLPATRSACAREPLVKISSPTGQLLDRSAQARDAPARRRDRCRARSRGTPRVHACALHEAGERRAELAVVGFLQMARVVERHAEKAGDELAHALVDLGEQVALGRVERVVEIEDPRLRCDRSHGAMPRGDDAGRGAWQNHGALAHGHALMPTSLRLGATDQRADAMLGEEFEQYAVRHATVDDDDGLDAGFDHLDAALRSSGSCRR